MKALEKDRNRRYETANGFALDVQRYLADEPVQACPPSAGYGCGSSCGGTRGRCWRRSPGAPGAGGRHRRDDVGLVRAEQRAEGERQAKDTAEKRLAQIEKGTEVLGLGVPGPRPEGGGEGRGTLRDPAGPAAGGGGAAAGRRGRGRPAGRGPAPAPAGAYSLPSWATRSKPRRCSPRPARPGSGCWGPTTSIPLATKHNLAMAYRDRGKHAQAEQTVQGGAGGPRRPTGARPPRHPQHQAQPGLGCTWTRTARPAEPLLRRSGRSASPAARGRRPHDPPEQAQPGRAVHDRQGKYAQAESPAQGGAGVRTPRLGPGTPSSPSKARTPGLRSTRPAAR